MFHSEYTQTMREVVETMKLLAQALYIQKFGALPEEKKPAQVIQFPGKKVKKRRPKK